RLAPQTGLSAELLVPGNVVKLLYVSHRPTGHRGASITPAGENGDEDDGGKREKVVIDGLHRDSSVVETKPERFPRAAWVTLSSRRKNSISYKESTFRLSAFTVQLQFACESH